jgi:hypothetical protein
MMVTSLMVVPSRFASLVVERMVLYTVTSPRTICVKTFPKSKKLVCRFTAWSILSSRKWGIEMSKLSDAKKLELVNHFNKDLEDNFKILGDVFDDLEEEDFDILFDAYENYKGQVLLALFKTIG